MLALFQVPYLVIGLSLVGGIVCQFSKGLFLDSVLLFALVLFVGWCLNKPVTLILMILFFLLGHVLVGFHGYRYDWVRDNLSKDYPSSQWISATVVSHPVPSESGISFLIEVPAKQIEVPFRCRVFAKIHQIPDRGDQIQIYGKLKPVLQPRVADIIRGIQGKLSLYGDPKIRFVSSHPSLLLKARKKILQSAQKYLGPIQYTYYRVMVFGDQGLLNVKTLERLKQTGLLHLFVVSGFHISFVWLIGIMVFRILSGWYRNLFSWRYYFLTLEFLALVFVFGFLEVINPPISAIRSVASMFLFVVIKVLGRFQHPLWSLGLVFFSILLIHPYYLFDVSTQLTFGAVAGLFLGSDFVKWWRSDKNSLLIPQAWIESVGATLGASIFTLPILWFHFDQINLASLAYNLMITPTIGAVLSFASVASILLPLFPEFVQNLGFAFLQELIDLFIFVLFLEFN